MVERLHLRRWKKWSGTDEYWVVILMHKIWEYWNILSLDQKSLWISGHFDTW